MKTFFILLGEQFLHKLTWKASSPKNKKDLSSESESCFLYLSLICKRSSKNPLDNLVFILFVIVDFGTSISSSV